MVLWFSLAILTGLAVLALLWPLSRAEQADEADDTVFYRQELADIDRDAERGLIGSAEAEAARAEAARRLLAAQRKAAGESTTSFSPQRIRWAALFVLVAVPLIALSLYLRIASPNVPDQPLASRVPDTQGVGDAVAQIERHLAQNPNDGRGYEVVAPVYMQMGRYDDAVRSLSEAARLLGPTATRLSALGQARVAQAGGVVTAAARADFDRAIALDSNDMRARFFLAIALEQDGNKAKSIDAFRAIAAQTDPASPIGEAVAAKIAELQPQTEAGAAIAAMPQNDQTKMIRAMVAGLAQKLETNPADIEGWLRLIRSYAVLGEKSEAEAAITKARTVFANNADMLRRINDEAKGLKIGAAP
jgi:cytochrome c-type biogenesis protein CcmH